MKIILCGINGRMGRVICECAKERGIEITAGIDVLNPIDFNGIPVYSDYNKLTEEADLILDFSHHSQTKNILEYAVLRKISLVIAATGQTTDEMDMIIETSKKHPIFYSRNMSLGINSICELAKYAAQMLGEDFDIEIIEMHHRKKLDAPSGTALMISEEIKSVLPFKTKNVTERASKRTEREKNEIGMTSVRGGSIIGEHEVLFCGNGETIKISHSAIGREVFAEGALRACNFMRLKQPGLYTMRELLREIKIPTSII